MGTKQLLFIKNLGAHSIIGLQQQSNQNLSLSESIWQLLLSTKPLSKCHKKELFLKSDWITMNFHQMFLRMMKTLNIRSISKSLNSKSANLGTSKWDRHQEGRLSRFQGTNLLQSETLDITSIRLKTRIHHWGNQEISKLFNQKKKEQQGDWDKALKELLLQQNKLQDSTKLTAQMNEDSMTLWITLLKPSKTLTILSNLLEATPHRQNPRCLSQLFNQLIARRK